MDIMKRNMHSTTVIILVSVLLAASLSEKTAEAFGKGFDARGFKPRGEKHITEPQDDGSSTTASLPPPPPPTSSCSPPTTVPPPPLPEIQVPPPPVIQVPPPAQPPAQLATRTLKNGFYANTACSSVEAVVKAEVKKKFDADPSIVALLLRIYFHDCFANSQCDASLLIKQNKNGEPTEQDAGSNEGIRGLDFIDFLKGQVKASCVGNQDLVSCADIIALAVRDAVALAAKRPPYAVPTGRLDGKVSIVAEGDTLPGPTQPIATIVARFEKEGFSPEEMVVLSGAHTVGQARCKFTRDPATAESSLATELSTTCTNAPENRVFLDQGANSAFVVDSSYYAMVTQNRGVMESDQGLLTDTLTASFVNALATGTADFLPKFEAALVKMGNLGPLTNITEGDIRHVCSVLN